MSHPCACSPAAGILMVLIAVTGEFAVHCDDQTTDTWTQHSAGSGDSVYNVHMQDLRFACAHDRDALPTTSDQDTGIIQNREDGQGNTEASLHNVSMHNRRLASAQHDIVANNIDETNGQVDEKIDKDTEIVLQHDCWTSPATHGCFHGGSCVEGARDDYTGKVVSHECRCKYNFYGERCRNVNPCYKVVDNLATPANRCGNGGLCLIDVYTALKSPSHIAYWCKCPDNITGAHCETILGEDGEKCDENVAPLPVKSWSETTAGANFTSEEKVHKKNLAEVLQDWKETTCNRSDDMKSCKLSSTILNWITDPFNNSQNSKENLLDALGVTEISKSNLLIIPEKDIVLAICDSSSECNNSCNKRLMVVAAACCFISGFLIPCLISDTTLKMFQKMRGDARAQHMVSSDQLNCKKRRKRKH